MSYVIDSSVAVKWVLAEKDDAQARRSRTTWRPSACGARTCGTRAGRST
jgi:hypothetical protein